MQDRLKFTVWDKKEKRYINFEQFKKGDIEFNFNPQTNEIWIEYDTSRYVVEQCAGLKDKNGKLIYENDLIDFYGKTYQIIWDNDFACFSIKNNNSMHPISDITQSSVMSNIHENPELLEKKENEQ